MIALRLEDRREREEVRRSINIVAIGGVHCRIPTYIFVEYVSECFWTQQDFY